MCWAKLKTIEHSYKNVPLSESSSPPWCLKLLTGLSFCFRPLRSCRAPEQCTCWTPLKASEPVTQTLSCELNLIETLRLCLFLQYSHTVALFCNVASHNSNKWTFIFNASTVATLSTQYYGAKPGPLLARKTFAPYVKMCWTCIKTTGA